MEILRGRVSWRRPQRARSFALTPDEQTNVRAALWFARDRLGSWPVLAIATGGSLKTLENAAYGRSRPTPGMAIRVAQATGVTVESVLAGKLDGR